MQQQIVKSLDHNFGKLQNKLCQFPFLGIVETNLIRLHKVFQLLRSYASIATDWPDACVGIEHVDGRVALVLQHLVKAEHVVIGAVVRQIRIFDAAVCDRFLRLFELVLSENFVALFFLKLFQGSVKTFVQ